MTEGTPGSLEVALEVPEPGRLCPGLRRDPPPTGLPWFLRASSSGAEVGLPEALPLTPAPHSRLSHSLEAWLLLQVQPLRARGRQKGLEARLAAGSAGGSQQGGEMGRPPGPHSTPAPEGTSAVTGLILDLISGLHWPRWALIALAVAAGVLTVSCLLCVICCCCRRRHHGHRKKPRDREAMGLSSPQGTTTSAHLVQPDVDSLEGGPQHWGCLQLSLEYDFGSQEVRVGLKQATDLRAWGSGSTADPYTRVSLSTQAGHRHETKVHHGTLCPMFQETCCFHVPQEELSQTTLQVQVLSFKRFSTHEPLGELSLPLGTMDLHHVLEHWYQLGPPGTVEPEAWGVLCFSLQYMPSSGRLTVVVLEARGLSPGLAVPYVKVQLMLNQRKWKKRRTSVRKGTASPYFNEAFSFLVPFSQIQSVDLVLAVWARGPQFRAECVGKVLLGARASGQPLQHWADMLAHARRPVAQWHHLQLAGEVDRALALKSRLRLPMPGS
uniref:synaptotagmin-8 isoform X1 n=1 Tax=Nyctereutes procyonoides TaxID=34880 RepID=UPI002444E09D|nr:synaptotagmin-8 isoform X1 [Nyctereutes procyonoides]